MERREAKAGDRVPVLGCRIPDVLGELKAWVIGVGAAHVPVAGLLREHRRSGNRRALRVATDDRSMLGGSRAEVKAVAKADASLTRDLLERITERREVRDVQPARVDPRRAAGHDRDSRREPEDQRVQLGSPLGRVLLGVVEGAQRADRARRQPLEVEQDSGGDEGSGEAAATGLVGASHVADTKRPIKCEQPPASPPRTTAGRLRGIRSCPAASM